MPRVPAPVRGSALAHSYFGNLRTLPRRPDEDGPDTASACGGRSLVRRVSGLAGASADPSQLGRRQRGLDLRGGVAAMPLTPSRWEPAIALRQGRNGYWHLPRQLVGEIEDRRPGPGNPSLRLSERYGRAPGVASGGATAEPRRGQQEFEWRRGSWLEAGRTRRAWPGRAVESDRPPPRQPGRVLAIGMSPMRSCRVPGAPRRKGSWGTRPGWTQIVVPADMSAASERGD